MPRLASCFAFLAPALSFAVTPADKCDPVPGGRAGARTAFDAPEPGRIDPFAAEAVRAGFPAALSPVKLTASDGAALDYFGRWVAVDGDTAVIGAFGDDSCKGSAYVFVRNGTAWTQQARLTASDGVAGDVFGRAVALDGDTAVVGAFYAGGERGSAYVFVRNGTTWTEQAKLTASDGLPGDWFGRAVAVSGSTIAAGAHGDDDARGSVYVFVGSGSNWTQQTKMRGSDDLAGDYFGRALALEGDTLLVGAYLNGGGQGAAFVFTRSSGHWTEQTKLTASDGAAGDRLGYSVSLSGNTALAGALGANGMQGAAYLFVRAGAAWTQQAKLAAPDGAANDYFGYAVALSGETAVAGAFGDDGFKGSAYVFTRSGTAWNFRTRLTASDGAANDYFGYAVALDGATALIGAFADDNYKGSTYVFTLQAPASCTVSLTLNYANPTLTVGYTISNAVAGGWHGWLSSSAGVQSLWAVPVGVVNPPASGQFSMNLPPMGPVGVISAITHSGTAGCHDVKTIDTGAAADRRSAPPRPAPSGVSEPASP